MAVVAGPRPETTAAPALTVLRWGPQARQALAAGATGQVVALFDNSFYLSCGAALVCVAGRDLGNGPLNIAAAGPSGAPVVAGLRTGARVVLDCDRAAPWDPPPPGPYGDPAARRRAWEIFCNYAFDNAPADGLGRLIVGGGEGPVLRRASESVRLLSAWLARVSVGQPALRTDEGRAAIALLGLGPGLTPSGDDYLGGLLIALHGLGQGHAAGALSAAIRPRAPARTTPVSLAHLRAAMNGVGGEAAHRVFNALVEGDVDGLPGRLTALGRIGHTSGWDAMAGIAAACGAGFGDPWICGIKR